MRRFATTMAALLVVAAVMLIGHAKAAAPVIADRVRETTSSTGTGTIDLSGAVTAYQTFVAGAGDGNPTYYCIQQLSVGAWEIGLGTVTDAATDTLSRTTILQSSNADALVNFGAGEKDVFLVLPADKSLFRDADGDMPAAEDWDGLQTFNAGAAIAASQGVTMANDTWIGAGVGKARVLFDDSNNEVDILDATLRLPADEQLLEFGATQQYSIQFDADAVHTISAGQFRFVGGNVELEDTTDADAGVIAKGADRFIHNFHHPTGGGAVPVGENIFIGVNAGNFTVGSTATETYHSSYNVAVGDAALDALSTGYYNMAVGRAALGACETGVANVAVGANALLLLVVGSSNVAIGHTALGNCTGSSNVGIGQAALQRMGAGTNNVGVGLNAGRFIADGSTSNITTLYSVYLGSGTRASADGADNEVVIGYNAIGKGANTMVLGGSTLTSVILPNDTQTLQLGAAQDYSVQWDGSDAVHTVTAGDFVFTGGNVGIGTATPAMELHVAGDIALPNAGRIQFDNGTGAYIAEEANGLVFYSTTAVPSIDIDGNGRIRIGSAWFDSNLGGNVGIGRTDPPVALSMGDDKLIAADTNAGLTASVTQSQGQGALTAQVNEISTVANDDDTVTLPAAVAGVSIEIINHGANTLQIFPASGDNLGTGVDTAEQLEANESVKYVAYDGTNWSKEATTEIVHAEMHDEDNTDAYVINDAGGDFHAYHTNGLAAGDLADWTFDAGGGGTSFPVASIADSPGSSGTQAQITTTGSHGLAAGDIVSLTNMSAGTNAGFHVVLAPIAATTFEIASSNSTDATGTMDQAATLDVITGSAGVYSIFWSASATSAANNETFDFEISKNATTVVGTKTRRKFGTATDFGSFSGLGIVSIANGDKLSFALSNEDSAANLTIRNLTIVLIRL